MARRNRIRNNNRTKTIDKSLLALVFILLLFGVVIIYDATVILSQELYGSAYRFALLQLSWIAVGLVGFYIFSRIDLKTLRQLSVVLFGGAVVFLLVLALFGVLPCSTAFPFAPCINGANRWFYLNPAPFPEIPLLGVLGFQPSEFAKFALILFLAALLEKRIRLGKNPFWVFLGVSGVIAGLIMLQPNMSTAVLIFLIAAVMFFSTGVNIKEMLLTLPIFGIMGALFMVSSEYRRARLLTFLSATAGEELSSGYHIKQVLIALGSGGLWGVGFGQSRQKFQYLPEVFADSIFAIIGEELGFIGTFLLILTFSFLVYKGYSIAKKSPDVFGKLVAVGMTTWIGLQFFINVAAMTKLIPLTGIPLPLISYGGSSLVFMLMGLGVLANVSRVQK